MKLESTLAKQFDVEISTKTEEGTILTVLEVYEKDNDCEFMFSLTTADDVSYTVGNVYSTLEHGTVLTEKELKVLLKNKSIKAL